MNLPHNTVHIWHYRLAEDSLDLACVSAEEAGNASRFVHARHQQRYLATRCLLRQLLSRYASIAPADWRFEVNAHGKPRIAAELEVPLTFNLSVTADQIACAITSKQEIGVDIESRIPKDFWSIAESNFAVEERNWLAQAGEEQSGAETAARDRFLVIWTLKEAYVKAIGTGLSTPLTDFCILPIGSGSAQLVYSHSDREPPLPWLFKRFRLPNGVPLSVAVQSSHPLKFELRDFKLADPG